MKELRTRVRVQEPRRWAEIGWTLAGARVGGWRQVDEEKWAEAVDMAEKELLRGAWWKSEEGSKGGWVEMKACVVIGVK